MIDLNEAAVRVFEQSALVRAIERGAVRWRAWGSRSAVIRKANEWLPAVRSRTGHVLLSAALTHVILIAVVAPPISWQWIILPSIIAAAGVILILAQPHPGQR